MTQKPIPKPLAMIICDTVIHDRKTGKKSLINMFDNINATKVPCIHNRLNVYVSLTEGHNDYNGMLRCIYEDENKTVGELRGPIVFKTPHQIVEFNFEIAGLSIPKHGNYRFDFYCDNELVISRKFKVSSIKLEKK